MLRTWRSDDAQNVAKWQKAASACMQMLSADDQYQEIASFLNSSKIPNKERLYPLLAATGTDTSVSALDAMPGVVKPEMSKGVLGTLVIIDDAQNVAK